MAAAPSATSVHDFTVKDASGKDVNLSTYKGKVLLIVNVASQWYLIHFITPPIL
jgi:glutathione peroxidase